LPLTKYKRVISNSSPLMNLAIIEQQADLILLDETDARNVADLYNLSKTGVIGIVTRAKRHHLIREVTPLFNALKTQANFWIQPRLYEAILKHMKELP